MNIPKWILDVFYSYLTSELIYFDGEYPIATPVATFFNPTKNSIILSTSVSFYNKVKCIKQNPNVSILYSKHEYSGLSEKPVVLVHGSAKVHEKDFEKNNAYLSKLIEEQKETWKKEVYIKMGRELDSFIGRRLMDWYMLRILIEIIPDGIVCWKKEANILGSVDDLSKTIGSVKGDAVFAFMGEKYPIGIPVKLRKSNRKFLIENPTLNLKEGQKACLLIHSHNKYVKEITLTRYKGRISRISKTSRISRISTREGEIGEIEFIPTSKFSFKQGGILNSIRFILDGKRRAKKFLERYKKT
ncbi:hypothetical protein DRP07_12390 [Archaeoglobales archaeon]|nr:MAG: hypothetical protein DRP07_12390 [Archaeoglobales archaeon]